MRKFIMYCLLFFTSFLVVGCNQRSVVLTNSIIGSNETIVIGDQSIVVNNFDYATMGIVESSLSLTGLTLEFTYTGEHQGLYGSPYTLLVYSEGEWSNLPNILGEEYISWTGIGYMMENGEVKQFEIDWTWLYGELSPGHYCVMKSLNDFRGTGDYTEYRFANEFTIE